MNIQRNTTYCIVLILFFASGLSSLVYQVVWTQQLVLVFGATTLATSTTLAIFMGGLALGAFVAGKSADSLTRPLLWYGGLETGIGAWALMAPFFFAGSTAVYAYVWQHVNSGGWSLLLARVTVTGVILLIPTSLMGASLPILARFVSTEKETIGNKVGVLYAANTLGAICGAFLAGFIFLPEYGMNYTNLIAAGINFALLIPVAALHRASTRERASLALTDANTGGSDANQQLTPEIKMVVAAFACSGAIAMIYEVCWTRALLLVIGSSTYAFTIMLIAFLSGIFAGSVICAQFVDRLRQPMHWLASAQIALGVLTFLCMLTFNHIPPLNLMISSWFTGSAELNMVVRFLFAGLILIPITFCLGALFPIVVRCCTTSLERVGHSIGWLYAANTIGAIIGALAAGFLLIPTLGAERTLIFGAAGSIVIGLAILAMRHRGSKITIFAISAAGLAVVAGAVLTPGIWDRSTMSIAQSARRDFRNGASLSLESAQGWYRALLRGTKLMFWADGLCCNVSVMQAPSGRRLITNGQVDASDVSDTAVQALLSAFPLLVKPDAKTLAVVGWGSGQTIGTALMFPITAVDAIELERQVIEASKLFHNINGSPENDPRVNIKIEDGRNFLSVTNKQYDMILSEPSNPWKAGVCNLFTAEYFQICRQRLNPGGMCAFWMQAAEVPPSDLSSVLSAIKGTFKNILVLQPLYGNLIVLASDTPIQIDFSKVQRIFENPKFSQAWKPMGIDSVESFLARIAATNAGVQRLQSRFTNHDDHNRLEFDVARTYEQKTYFKENEKLLNTLCISPWEQVDWGTLSKEEKSAEMFAVSKHTLNKTMGSLWVNAAK